MAGSRDGLSWRCPYLITPAGKILESLRLSLDVTFGGIRPKPERLSRHCNITCTPLPSRDKVAVAGKPMPDHAPRMLRGKVGR